MQQGLNLVAGWVNRLTGSLGVKPSTPYKSFYDLESKDIDGKPINFNRFRGKVVLLCNVASLDAATKQHYQEFKLLQGDPSMRGLEIVIMPCNQFMRREPGHADEIKAFVTSRGFTGTVMEKGDVNGPDTHPVWLYLKVNSLDTSDIGWNFGKFIVAKDGRVHGRYGPAVPPSVLQYAIQKLLTEETREEVEARGARRQKSGRMGTSGPALHHAPPPATSPALAPST